MSQLLAWSYIFSISSLKHVREKIEKQKENAQKLSFSFKI